MENINKIACPKCGHHFNAEQAIAHDVEEKLKSEYNQKFKVLQAKIAKESEEKIAAEKAKIESEKLKLEAALKEKVKEDFEFQLKNLAEENEQRKKENLQLKNKEIEFLKKERELKDREAELEIALQKKLLEKAKELEEEIKKKAEDINALKMKEKDLQLQSLKEQIEIMKRKAEQGSMQTQGEAQELLLEELLRSVFTFDLVEEVGKGVRGADVVQTVRSLQGKECGKIIYESKRTKAFSESWIEKLKSDLRGQKADIAVIVTETMPKDMDRFGCKDGIWICSFQEVKSVAMVLRDCLLKIYDIRSSEENKGDKMQMLYNFLTGNEFRQHMEAIVEGFTCMQDSLNKEKLVTQKLWKQREKEIEKVLQNTVEMYGSIKGIAGKAIADIKQLDTQPNLLLEEETPE